MEIGTRRFAGALFYILQSPPPRSCGFGEGDETQNSQLLISAEVIRRGWGEAELIF